MIAKNYLLPGGVIVIMSISSGLLFLEAQAEDPPVFS